MTISITHLPSRALAAAIALALASVGAVVSIASPAQALTIHTITSPDGNTSLTVQNENDGSLTYTVQQDGQSIIDTSSMGLVTSAVDLSIGLSYVGFTTRVVDETYELVAHKITTSVADANELTLNYSKSGTSFSVIVQAHGDGVAFRYVVAGSGTASVTDEYTTFNLPSGTGNWASPFRSASDYEDIYPYLSATNMGTARYAFPILSSLRDNTQWALITEASVCNLDGNYPAINVVGTGTGTGSRVLDVRFPPDQIGAVSSALPLTTPWRVIHATATLNELVRSSLVTDLNPASELVDESWVVPGKASWSWWSDEGSAASLDKQLRYVDSAEAAGFEYVTVDCCWLAADIPTIVDYAQARGIGIFLWTDADAIDTPGELSTKLPLWKSWGIKGLKIDFFMSDTQQRMGAYNLISDAAAANELMVNFHGSTKPSGENRTWPHVITSEAILGSEQYKYGRPPTAKHDATVPFTRNVIGGMDMTPVIISPTDLLTTQSHQLALSVVFESAMTHFADSDAAYQTWIGRHFLKVVPTVWNDTILVEGFPDSYATFARKSGDEWYVGAIADAARTATIPLSFLGSGNYTATIFKDGANDQQIVTQVLTVTSVSTLSIALRLHGGASVQISKTPLSFDGTADRLYEAESGSNTRTGSTVADCPGCSGTDKVGDLGNGNTVRFNGVTAASAGQHLVTVGYLSADARDLTVSVNGATPTLIDLESSGGWNIVGTATVAVTLTSGANTLTFGNASGYAPDIDRIVISRPYEAEAAGNVKTGNASTATCAGCSGGNKVGNLYGASTLGFTGVNAQVSGSTTIRIHYASADERSVQVRVGSGTPVTLTLPPTGGWNVTSVKTIALPLVAGSNTITFDSAGGYAPDIDRIVVSQ